MEELVATGIEPRTCRPSGVFVYLQSIIAAPNVPSVTPGFKFHQAVANPINNPSSLFQIRRPVGRQAASGRGSRDQDQPLDALLEQVTTVSGSGVEIIDSARVNLALGRKFDWPNKFDQSSLSLGLVTRT